MKDWPQKCITCFGTPFFQLWTDLAETTDSVGLGFAPLGETLARRLNPQNCVHWGSKRGMWRVRE